MGSFENFGNRIVKKGRDLATGVLMAGGALGSAAATEAPEQVPQDTNQNTIEVTAEESVKSVENAVNFQDIEKLNRLQQDLETSKKKLHALEDTYAAIHQKALGELKGSTAKNFDSARDLISQIKTFVDFYQEKRPNADLTSSNIQQALLEDVASVDNHFTGAKYSFVTQGVNQKIGNDITFTGQQMSENMQMHRNIKASVDSALLEYAKIKQLEKQIKDLENGNNVRGK